MDIDKLESEVNDNAARMPKTYDPPIVMGTLEMRELISEVRRLREGLKPFADAVGVIPPHESDDYGAGLLGLITAGDLRRASAALSTPGPQERG